MPRINWPDDHPNTKILMFCDWSRQVLVRTRPSSSVTEAATLLDQIEALIDDMTVDKTRPEILQLVAQVGPLVNEAAARMDGIGEQLQREREREREQEQERERE